MSKYRPPLKKTILAVLAVAVLAGLGSWQLKRLSWKEDLLQRIDVQMSAKPSPLPSEITDAAAIEYKPFVLRGRYLHDHEMLLKPRTENGKTGYHVITPLREASGRIVLVDRGFTDHVGLASFLRPKGEQVVAGVATLPKQGSFTPDNMPATKDWYWVDISAMTEGLGKAAPVLIVKSMARPDIPNDHRQYAIFWFLMAGILIVVFILSERKAAHD